MLGQVKVDEPTEVLVPAAWVKYDITEADVLMKVAALQQHGAVTCRR